MKDVRVWDIFVRVFHWSLVLFFVANAFLVDDESDLHIWIGYAVAALVAARLIWGVVGTSHARFSDFPPSVAGAMTQLKDLATGRKRLHLGHTPLGALMIYNLLLTLIVICVSGYLMTTDMFWGTEWTEELHEAAVSWAEFSILLHIGGVLYETVRSGINLPAAMVTGYKKIPDTDTR